MTNEQKILAERAQHLAAKLESVVSEKEGFQVVTFLLGIESYAIETKFVREVITLRELTQIPGVPAFVMGVINFRGVIISVINLKVFFGLKEKGLTELNKVIIVKGENLEFGIVADGITGNMQLLHKSLSAAPLTLKGPGADFVTGITSLGLILLDAGRMLRSKQLIIDQK
ncbi:MAG: chemotaxis protein CheW [Bacteroidetes bacterium HGW-Bacteroidetes-1]|jgi:purine-binding chemotaxis protein CheW|nr:MAG: chemotaxis protein CheW [Bacteroidetes bacterium HGW-Bacteroidetes-1]